MVKRRFMKFFGVAGLILLGLSAKAEETLSSSRIVSNTDLFKSVRLISATDRYNHCVLGDCIEAGGVEVTLKDGTVLRHQLDQDSVFEDLVPRVVPLGEQGRDAILLVRADARAGAALMLLEVRDGNLVQAAEGPSIGTAHRWQNPVGVADFDGDGRLEIATVITPHIGGTLSFYERHDDELIREYDIFGFSNHVIGSEKLGLSLIHDVTGDGIADIILPDRSRRSLLAVSVRDGAPVIVGQRTVDFSLDHDFILSDNGKLRIGSNEISLNFD